MQKYKIHLIWIWWIWISALARYYLTQSYTVYWSDTTASEITENLKNEWINIYIWNNSELINKDFDLVVYSEAIEENNIERVKANKLWIKTISYPQALAEITNNKKLITIAWTHWKSTTSSMISLILKNSEYNFTSIVWTLIKEFWNKNFFHRKDNYNDDYFIIEACEYKNSFLNYKPTIWVIINIELDHIDFFKNIDNYINSFKSYIDNIKSWWFAIINWQDCNCKKLIWIRKDIKYIEVFDNYFIYNDIIVHYPILDISILWEHIQFDAKIAYTVWYIIWISNNRMLDSLKNYNWVWRRMEKIWKTIHNNILISDYGHHPTEIFLTLKSIKENNLDKKILTIFQPHQYSRTLELLNDFKNCFYYTDYLIISDIYESRDTKEYKDKINVIKFLKKINHKNKKDWKWLNNTLKLIKDFDKNNTNCIILLLWAWNIDNLRYKIKTVF